MHGIISLLPEPYYKKVKLIWKGLEEKFGIKIEGGKVTVHPHFSWQLAADYDAKKLEEILRDIAKETKPFAISTSGIGIFSVENPILYIPIVKTESLIKLHKTIWEKTTGARNGISQFYSPENWIPHISLTYENLTKEDLGKIIKELSTESYLWSFDLDNISFISTPTGKMGELKFKIELT